MENINGLLDMNLNIGQPINPIFFIRIAGIVLTILLLCFDAFALVLMKQVGEMSKNVITPAGKPLKVASIAFFVIGIVLTLLTILNLFSA